MKTGWACREPAWRRGVPWTGGGGDSPATREYPSSKAFSFLYTVTLLSNHTRTNTHFFQTYPNSLFLSHTLSQTHTHSLTHTHVLRVFWMKLHSKRVWRHKQLLLMHRRPLLLLLFFWHYFFFNRFFGRSFGGSNSWRWMEVQESDL